jgi:hypothetical protein
MSFIHVIVHGENIPLEIDPALVDVDPASRNPLFVCISENADRNLSSPFKDSGTHTSPPVPGVSESRIALRGKG